MKNTFYALGVLIVTMFVGCSKPSEKEPASSAAKPVEPSATAPTPEAPSSETIDPSVRQILESLVVATKPSIIRGDAPVPVTGKVAKYSIENSFQKLIDGETWFIYEIDSIITARAEAYSQDTTDLQAAIMVGFVKRGKKWYAERIQL